MQIHIIFLGIACFLGCYRNAYAHHTLIAPQIIREGVEETIVLNLYSIEGIVEVIVTVKGAGDLKNFQFPNQDATKPIPLKVMYQTEEGQKEKQPIEVIVIVNQNGGKLYDTSVKMKYVDERGYLYVQTDRPIYRPKETVKVRVTAVKQKHCPELDREVEVVIRIPLDNVAVDKKLLRMPYENFIDTDFELPEFPVLGVWSIQARFVDEKYTKWSEIKFSVREYVLPTFNVKLTLDKPYILVKSLQDMADDHIEGTITAEYSYGKPVTGSYFLVAKLNRPKVAPTIFKQIPDKLGKKAVLIGQPKRIKIRILDLLLVIGQQESIEDLQKEGATVTIDVSVTGKAEGTIEVDSSAPIPFVTSPYDIDISRMSKYYIPGTTFEIKVDVVDSVSRKPVKDVQVVVTKANGDEVVKDDTDENGQINQKINMDADLNVKTYQIFTRDFNVPDPNEAKKEVKLNPYKSDKNQGSILQLSAVDKIAQVGDINFEIDVWLNKEPKEIRYVVFARGCIVGYGVHIPLPGSVQTNFKIIITANMVPSFRIFVYYINGEEIVSNSLWIDVDDACKTELKVTVPELVRPGERFQVQYEGSPNAVLGMSAVDRAAYFLYDEGRLTREKFFKSLDHYDDGCVREGGKDAQDVFEEGGLQLVGGKYVPKEAFVNSCDGGEKKRKRRDIEKEIQAELDEKTKLINCENDGKLENLMEENCAKRAKIVEKNEIKKKNPKAYECAEIFNQACINTTRLSKVVRGAGRVAGDNAGGFKKVATSARSNFEENMLWATAILDPNGQHTQPVTAKDSITTFEFDTISMHNCDGVCVADTKNLKIFKDVFIQLKTPYSLKRMEQVELRATVFNYGAADEETTVYVKMGKDICSHFPEEKFTKIQTLYLPKNAAKTTSFTLLPLRIPDDNHIYIELQVEDKYKNRLDWIRKSILVEPEGIVKEFKGTRAIDLKKKRSDDFEIEFSFPEKYLPKSRQCWLYPYSNFMGPIIEFDPVTRQPKNDVAKLIRMPGGCGEQTMLSMGPNVFAHKYLRSIGRMADGSPEEKGSIDKMKSGFANELKYRSSSENVWSVFPRHQPSVWLNAYVNKVFAQAKQFYTTMDVTPICNSVAWLVKQQGPDGGFLKGGRVIHTEMHGAVSTPLSITAYVLMSLVESSSLCPAHIKAVEMSMDKAIRYLTNNENSAELNQPYTLSLTTYAMVVADLKNPFTVRLIAKLKGMVNYSPDGRLASWKGAPLAQIQGTNTHAYWYQRRPLAIDVEATGYSMLAIIYFEPSQVTPKTFELTRKIALWLIEQRDNNGGFTTTQDTVVGLHALSEYMIWSNAAEPPKNEVKIDLTLSGAQGTDWFDNPSRIHLDKSNENYTSPITVPASVINSRKIYVKAEGEGDGSLSYRCVYRTLVEEDSCHFEISVTTALDRDRVIAPPGQLEQQVLKVSLYIRKPIGKPSGQSIVEVNLISGYTVIERTLEEISKAFVVDGIVERYELANQKVILYLDEITEEAIRTAFLITRTANIAVPEPSSVTVYDYYEPSIKCTQFYGLPNDIPKLRVTPCKNDNGGEDMCKCAEGGCVKCRSRDDQLKKTACLPGVAGDCTICENPDSGCYDMAKVACASNYVYEIHVTKGVDDETGIFVEFEAEIRSVYKRGNDVQADRNEVRKFMTRTDCFHKCEDPALNINIKDGEKKRPFISKDRSFLVIGGEDSEVTIQKNGESKTIYRIDKDTHLERIIPEDKCRKTKEKLKKKCKNGKRSPSCDKSRAMDQSCENLRLLRRLLIKGCDIGEK